MKALQPPADTSITTALGLRWYNTADGARDVARQRTLATGVTHIVIALDHGTVTVCADGRVRRNGIVGDNGKLIGNKMFLPFNHSLLATYMDGIRLNPAYGPSCLNLYEETNTDRPRRVGFDLEFELDHVRKDGSRDHEACARALWPADYTVVARCAELFFARVVIDRLLPAVNALAGTALTTHECHVLDSCTATKHSFHVVTPLTLNSAAAVKAFSEWMQHTFKDGAHALSPLLDVTVYKTCGYMRLVLNRKPCRPGAAHDTQWLRPASRIGTIECAPTHDHATPGGAHPHTLDLLRQHAWTFVDAAASLVSLDDALRAVQAPSPVYTTPAAAPRRVAMPPSPHDPRVVERVRALYARHAGLPCDAALTLERHTLRRCEETTITSGDIVMRDGGIARQLFVSRYGNVFVRPASQAAMAVAIVERVLSDARADTFDDWHAVGGALHSVEASAEMCAAWDRFSQRCPAKYCGPRDCAYRWSRFNGSSFTFGTLIHFGRVDNPAELDAILGSAPMVFIGHIEQQEQHDAETDTDATRHALRVILGDTASQLLGHGVWAAPPGRRCCRGVEHAHATTFETRVDATQTVHEACHACGGGPLYVGPLHSTQPAAALPVSAAVYGPAIGARYPTWTLRPCPPFRVAQHTLLAVFTIFSSGRREHADGRLRVLGITAEARVVLGVKRVDTTATPYAWTGVESWFTDALRDWFVHQHGVAALLPPPRVRSPSGVQVWTLPCCASTTACSRNTCRTETDTPWLFLRQLQAHGKLAPARVASAQGA